jgi:hypothetical protein
MLGASVPQLSVVWAHRLQVARIPSMEWPSSLTTSSSVISAITRIEISFFVSQPGPMLFSSSMFSSNPTTRRILYSDGGLGSFILITKG